MCELFSVLYNQLRGYKASMNTKFDTFLWMCLIIYNCENNATTDNFSRNYNKFTQINNKYSIVPNNI